MLFATGNIAVWEGPSPRLPPPSLYPPLFMSDELDFKYAFLTVNYSPAEKTSIQPMLIEVNYFPSLKRCCKYQPHLINDFFDMMFFNKLGDYFVELS